MNGYRKDKDRLEDTIGLARDALRPTMNAAVSCKHVHSLLYADNLEINGLIAALLEQVEALQRDDLSRPAAMLIAQAHTLDALFARLLLLGLNAGESGSSRMETYMRLALKAQSQCQSTLRALGDLKQPKQLAYITQANVAHGDQQINNAVLNRRDQDVDPSKYPPNELMEVGDDKQLEFGEEGAAKQADKKMETMGVLNRPEKPTRKEDGS